MNRREWIATYRLQVHRDFPLASAAGVLPYLVGLGISHVYLSPCLQATAGSTHGYDLVDPTRVSDDLGGEPGWRAFQEAARRHGLGVLLDIVPNHMSTAPENPWWRSVLRDGPFSDYAGFFDIFPCADGEPWRLRLCVLGCSYGDALREGKMTIDLDGEEPVLVSDGGRWPLTPLSWPLLFRADAGDSTQGHVDTVEAPPHRGMSPDATAHAAYARAVEHVMQRWRELRADAEGFAALVARVTTMSRDPDWMHSVLARQYYRLCSWRLEGEAVNYRRFFNIGGLIGLRMEDPRVFSASHARIARMLADGEIDGVRVDHPDGLRDPAGYLRELRTLVPDGRIYVEKILDNEELLQAWPVDGTVGYDFLSKVNRLWMHAEKADRLTAIYADFTGHTVNFPALVREKKLAILDTAFGADLSRLVDLAIAIARSRWQTQDLSRAHLRDAVRAVTALLAVYRTYLPGVAGADRDQDGTVLSGALAEARAFTVGVAPEVFDFLDTMLCHEDPDEATREFIGRWQQLTPAVMAKGSEDTTFYLYDRLVSGNEVGAQPSALGIPAEQFHAYCHRLNTRWPHNLLATSTHDNKRSEDVRLRISLLTEIPERWAEAVQAWSRMNHEAWRGRQPDRHAEYLLYQTLVGAWPLSPERAQAYMLKACREAKVHTSWHEPDADYEEAITGFVARILHSSDFTGSMDEFVAPLVRPAGIHSLAQTLIKLTAPGVPDFYQGTELSDLSLVDPDNRRPVDFNLRHDLLRRGRESGPDAVRAEWESGWPKLWMIARVLAFRRQHGSAFGDEPNYEPLVARGTKLAHVFGFRRGDSVLVLVPRFILSLGDGWGDTRVALPEGRWMNVLDGAWYDGDVDIESLFAGFPVALLHRSDMEAGVT